MAIAMGNDDWHKWAMAILKANGWTGDESHVRRIVIDVAIGRVPTIGVEQYGDTGTLGVKATSDMTNAIVYKSACAREDLLTLLCKQAYDTLGVCESEGCAVSTLRTEIANAIFAKDDKEAPPDDDKLRG